MGLNILFFNACKLELQRFKLLLVDKVRIKYVPLRSAHRVSGNAE